MTQNLCRSTKIRCTKCENLAKIHMWKSSVTVTIYEITRNCRFHKKKRGQFGTGGRLNEDAHLYRFCCHYNIIKTQWLIDFLSVTSSVAISVKLTKLFNNRKQIEISNYHHAEMSTEPNRSMHSVCFLRCALLAGPLINIKLCTG